MGIHGMCFTQKPLQKAMHVPADSKAGRRMTGAFCGNVQSSKFAGNGPREIARRKRQMERARG